MSSVIAIVSGKGGVGKSTLCTYLSAALAKSGHKTLCIDLDFGLRNLDVILGMERRCTYDLGDLFAGKCSEQKATLRHHIYKNLYFIPAAASVDRETVSIKRMKEIINNLKKQYDYILLDCPAGLNNGFVLAACVADSALLVTKADIFSAKDVSVACEALDKYNVISKRLIINAINPRLMQDGACLNVDEIIDFVKIQLIGLVCEDESVIVCANNGEIIDFNKSVAGRCIWDIAKRIEGQEVVQYKFW